MVMCFETDVFVDTKAYDTSRIPVVKNFFSILFWRLEVARISCCTAGGNSDATFGAALSSEPENFARTDRATESSDCVSAGGASAKGSFVIALLVQKSRNDLMFETFEHTADLGLRVAGDSLNDLFAEAAVGMTSLIVAEVGSVEATGQRTIELNSPDLEYLYFDWLSELLFLYESEGWLTAKASVEVTGNSLRGAVQGEVFSEDRHRRSHEVKAVTYHELSVVQQERAGKSFWTAEVIVDI